MSTTGERFERAVAIMERLRAPGGCPWDREQTFDSIKPYTLEETYEVLEAIDNRDWNELPGELGDLLLQVLFYSEMGKEQGTFSIDDVLDRLSNKLVNRHPHVFGDAKADTSADVKRNWEALQVEERKQRLAEGAETAEEAATNAAPSSILAGISSSMPALLEAHKLSSRAAQVGFDWPHIEALFDKLAEETEDLRERMEEEVGDLFFVLVNVARYLALDPESALRKMNRKFRRRFQWIEVQLYEKGIPLERASMDDLESLWQQAKQQERQA